MKLDVGNIIIVRKEYSCSKCQNLKFKVTKALDTFYIIRCLCSDKDKDGLGVPKGQLKYVLNMENIIVI